MPLWLILTAFLGSIARLFSNQLFRILDAHRLRRVVNHRVTVRANGARISNRINLVFLSNLGEGFEVMNVNESTAKPSKTPTNNMEAILKLFITVG